MLRPASVAPAPAPGALQGLAASVLQTGAQFRGCAVRMRMFDTDRCTAEASQGTRLSMTLQLYRPHLLTGHHLLLDGAQPVHPGSQGAHVIATVSGGRAPLQSLLHHLQSGARTWRAVHPVVQRSQACCRCGWAGHTAWRLPLCSRHHWCSASWQGSTPPQQQ